MKGCKIRHALIMAAGRGNRMRPLTDLLPKPMIPYNGDTLIGTSLSNLSNHVSFVHITVGYKKAMLSHYLMMKGVDTIINTEGHGNAWWISNSLMRFLNEPVLVLTTDNVTEIDLDFLNDQYAKSGQPVCMLVPVKPITGVEGDYIDHQEGVVTQIQREIPRGIYCSGIQVLNPFKVASLVEKEDFNEVWGKLIELNELMVSNIYPKVWFSVDTLEQLVSITNGLNYNLADY